MDGDTIAFGLLIGLPLLAISWLVAKLLLASLRRELAIGLCLALILAWPIYYVAMTLGDPGFAEGLPFILFTTPPMALGLMLALALGSRRALGR
ncbi:MAG TPA: hypothetical protein VIT45_17315 [Allosphingosinicella sp.]